MGKTKERKEVHINEEFLRPVRMIMFIIRYEIVCSSMILVVRQWYSHVYLNDIPRPRYMAVSDSSYLRIFLQNVKNFTIFVTKLQCKYFSLYNSTCRNQCLHCDKREKKWRLSLVHWYVRLPVPTVGFYRNWYTYLFLQGSHLNARNRAKT